MKLAAAKHKLVIVESPAKARTIAKFLGRGYKVEACNGHVRDLPKSQIGVGPENDFEPKYITIRGRGDVLDRLRKEAKGASQILLATDPDREGEAISWHLAHILKIDPDSPCRVEFHEITVQGRQGRDQAAARGQYAAGQRPAGAPRARPAGGLQDQPAAVGEGQKGLSARAACSPSPRA